MFRLGRAYFVGLLLLTAVGVFCQRAVAQSLMSGDLAGTVMDATRAVVPNATVTLKSLEMGSTQTGKTDAEGAYRFRLLKPGRYEVTAGHEGFRNTQRVVDVAVGVIITVDLALEVGQATQTIEVAGGAPILSTEPSMNTPFTIQEVEQLPSPGSDITNIAFSAPGVVVNQTAGYGNFTINGLPATSNLFTVNGEDDMDPYFNINNSGASNLTLGQNEIQEATVIANPYAGEYGQLAGAQVTYVTKSGTNSFHGNAQYWWNGRAMNSNDWFNNFYGEGRPFSNANQWAASVGGPIRKDKTFFFVNTEGLRFVLPDTQDVYIPTPTFAAAVLKNVQTLQPNEYATYQKLISVWQGALGVAAAQPIANSSYCNSVVLPTYNPKTTPCTEKWTASPVALGSEWMLMGRVDQKFGTNDTAFVRYKLDHGLQPTTVDAVNTAFDALSNQPAYDTQFNEIHIFSPRSTNSFTAAVSHYVAQFAQNEQAALNAFPDTVITSGAVNFGAYSPLRGAYYTNWTYDFPQGRNITQYQFIDDVTVVRGKHNLKFGVNFRRYDVSDHNFFYVNPAVYFGYNTSGMQNFVNGVAYQYRRSLTQASDVPVAMWGVGFYAQDEWAVAPNVKLTLALRAERSSNPVCQINCFANFKGDWSTLASVTSSAPGNVPYSSDINYGLHSAFPGMDPLDVSPRLGFSWSPGNDKKTVISGGFGIFYDSPPEGVLDDELANPPVSVAIRVRPAAGTLPFDPAGGPATWAASAAAFGITKTYTAIKAQMASLGAVFSAPAVDSFSGTFNAPRWEEWNFQFQRQFTDSTVLTLNYVGNHGGRIPYGNQWPNSYDPYGIFPGVKGVNATAAVPNYGVVTQTQSGAISNYDGLSATFRVRYSRLVTSHFNYTWSHNLDESSNGGVFTYGDSQTQDQINPTSLRANNYGNSDYDIRHNFNGDWVVTPNPHFSNPVAQRIFEGWQWSTKIYWRGGLPFTVTDGNWTGAIGNGAQLIPAQPISSHGQLHCGANAATTPCLNANAFVDSSTATWPGYSVFPSQTRNQYHGPSFFNADMTLFKTFKIRENMSFGVGAQAFNVFNHPNFYQPDSGIGDSTFGLVSSMQTPPTSPYGNFLGFDSSVRVIQLVGKLVF
jgi:hypothetical protein